MRRLDDEALNIQASNGSEYARELEEAVLGGGRSRPYSLSLGIVSECGESRCGYCTNWRSSAHKELSLEEITDTVREAKDLGVQQVLLSGGEPLYHSKWREVLAAVRGLEMDVLLITNGLLVDSDAIAALIDLGCKKIGISCDSLDDQRYQRIRGTSRAPLASALSLISQRLTVEPTALNVSLCMTLHRENSQEILPILDFAVSNRFSVQYQPYQSIGGGLRSIDQRFWPRVDQLSQIERDITEVRNRKRDGTANVASRDEYLAAIPHYFRTRAFHPKHCFAPAAQITIDEHSRLHPCWAMPSVGEIGRDGSLRDLWTGPAMQQARSSAYTQACPGCLYSCHVSKSYTEFPDSFDAHSNEPPLTNAMKGDAVTFLGFPQPR